MTALPLHALADTGVDLAALARRVRVLEHAVAQIARQRAGAPDGRLGGTLRLIRAFAAGSEWSATEILVDSGRAAPALWTMLDSIVGQRGSPSIKLALWLSRHQGIAADGLRLERVRVECGAWTYRVVAVGE